MTDVRDSDRDVNRAIRSWLHEDRHEDVSRVAGAVLDQVDTIPQRRATWPAWRTPTMNKLVTYGLGAAAVVVLLFAGSQLFGSSSGLFGTQPSPTPKPTLGPTPSSGASLPVGSSHVLWDGQQGAGPNFGINIAVTIPAPGWFGDVGEGILKKNDNADAPDGAGVTAYARTNDILVGLGDVYVYGDPCHWASTTTTSVTTVDEAIAALSAQPSRDATTAVDVTYDGYAGKYITLHVPDDAVISDCDRGEFRTFQQGQGNNSARSHEDPGQFDLFTVLDVNGQLVIFDLAYYEGTPETVLDEMAAILTSATLDYSP